MSADAVYTPSRVARVTGIDPQTLRSWERRGVLTQGEPYKKRYTLEEVATLLVVKRVLPDGRHMDPREALEIARPIGEEIAGVLKEDRQPRARFAILGEDVVGVQWCDELTVAPDSLSCAFIQLKPTAKRLRDALAGIT